MDFVGAEFRLRQDVARLEDDRYLAPDIAAAAALIASGTLAGVSGIDLPALLS